MVEVRVSVELLVTDTVETPLLIVIICVTAAKVLVLVAAGPVEETTTEEVTEVVAPTVIVEVACATCAEQAELRITGENVARTAGVEEAACRFSKASALRIAQPSQLCSPV